MNSPTVRDILFEPHPLWFAAMMQHFDRFNGKDFYKKTVEKFKNKGNGNLYGAKFALNPGIDALDWVWLDEVFDKPKFIFIQRDVKDAFKSYTRVDKDIRRGAITQAAYYPACVFVQTTFAKFLDENPDRAELVYYEELVKNADVTMAPVWNLLGATPVKGLNKQIEKPRHWSGK
jgi:hypothetical protein